MPAVSGALIRGPLLAVAAFEGPTTLGLTFLASVVLENLKAYVISPHVEGEQLKLDPLLVLIAVLAGAPCWERPVRSWPSRSQRCCTCCTTRSWLRGGSRRSPMTIRRTHENARGYSARFEMTPLRAISPKRCALGLTERICVLRWTATRPNVGR
jgi:hypothetical protein